MEILLGILIGIGLSLVVFIAAYFTTVRYSSSIVQKVKSINSILTPKGKIFEPESEELEGWVKEIERKENES